jgi:CopA family copper-resistance protein
MRILALLFTAVLLAGSPTTAAEYDLVVAKATATVDGRTGPAISINGATPGPTLRLKEGEEAVIRVTNNLPEETSIHWHGLILPGEQDGTPGMNGFPGIRPGQTFTYRFPVTQNGTYWYHAHSATQEQAGHYGGIVIEPAQASATAPKADREHVVLLSEFTGEDPERILRNLKVEPGYYNYSKRTLPEFIRDAGKFGLGKAVKDRFAWRRMNMDPTDIADTGNYTFLVNGKGPMGGETFLFGAGEKVKLRFVNATAMTYFDVRIPGLKMTVVASDGRDVEPVVVDEFRVAVAEAYDVIVEPEAGKAYSVFAESIDRSGYALAILAPRAGMTAPVPAMRPRALLTLSEMGHTAMPGMNASSPGAEGTAMDHAAMDHAGHQPAAAESIDHAAMGHGRAQPTAAMDHTAHAAASGPVDHAAMGHGPDGGSDTALPRIDYGMGREVRMAGMDHAAMGHGQGLGEEGAFDGSGRVFGWASGAPRGSRVLSYADLRSLEPQKDTRAPTREIVVRLTGNMERYVWTMDGRKFGEAEPFRMTYGDRVRVTFVNETMMAHPMHLHGMFMQAENGADAARMPDKTVLSVAPGKTASAIITADQKGEWAFHCHLLYHMEAGMMQKLVVATSDGPSGPATPAVDPHAGHGAHH